MAFIFVVLMHVAWTSSYRGSRPDLGLRYKLLCLLPADSRLMTR